jgi:nicotinamidase-related amidase
MPVTTLDPKTALIVIDLQKGIVALPTAHPTNEVVKHASESTARHAHENGFHVTLAVDAMTDMNADAHQNSITRILPRLGETGTTQEIIELLNER